MHQVDTWFSIRYATQHRGIFAVNAFSGKLEKLALPNLQDILTWSHASVTKISLILKNRMAALVISLKIIKLFLLAGSHNQKVESLHR